MTTYQWFVFFLLVQIVHFLGTWKLYEAAGKKKWQAAIPVYNSIILMKIIGRPTWWTVLLFIPVINLMMFPVIWVETLRSFGKRSSLDTFLGIITLGFYIYYISYTQKLEYKSDRILEPETKTADTISSLLFAIIVATLVHTYLIQPFTIPTSSLEKSLLVGDFLFVSKMHYGARTPMTAVSLPMVHDTIPKTKNKSYLKWPQLPYFRLPAFEKIKNCDIVVFNWPVDTVYFFRDPSGRHVDKPIDKKSNYVKRCVGIPGDSLAIKDGIVYINGKELAFPERAKPQYSYTSNLIYSETLDYQKLFKELNGYEQDRGGFTSDSTLYFPALTEESVKILKNTAGVTDVQRNNDEKNTLFSYDFKFNSNVNDDFLAIIKSIKESKKFRVEERINNIVRIYNFPKEFVEILKKKESVIYVEELYDIFPHTINQKNSTRDNMSPIYIPQAGKSVAINYMSLPFYSRIITEYEGNKLEIKGSDIYINGKRTTTYTFKQDYYWMMGDNRHNSEDSRYWGYVPADHIVGKPVFIWMSIDGINGSIKHWKIRWDRLFTTVGGDGQPQSYFQWFMIVLVGYFVGEYFWKKRKEKNTNV